MGDKGEVGDAGGHGPQGQARTGSPRRAGPGQDAARGGWARGAGSSQDVRFLLSSLRGGARAGRGLACLGTGVGAPEQLGGPRRLAVEPSPGDLVGMDWCESGGGDSLCVCGWRQGERGARPWEGVLAENCRGRRFPTPENQRASLPRFQGSRGGLQPPRQGGWTVVTGRAEAHASARRRSLCCGQRVPFSRGAGPGHAPSGPRVRGGGPFALQAALCKRKPA